MKWIATTTTNTQYDGRSGKQMTLQFATVVHENSSSFEYNSVSLHSFGRIFFSIHISPSSLSSCCFLQISVLLEVGNPRNSFYPIRGRSMQMSQNNILLPRLRKLDAFKIHYPRSGVTNSDHTLLLLLPNRKTNPSPSKK